MSSETDLESNDTSLLDQLGSLAAKLSKLSKAEEIPSDIEPEPTPFEPEDVNWSTNEWLVRLAGVQGWLNLAERLEVSADPEHSLHSLFKGLQIMNPSDAFVISEGTASLTPTGASVLDSLLDTGSNLQDDFLENILENGASVKKATKAWREAWEDESGELLDDSSEGLNANVDKWRIYAIRDQAAKGNLDLNPSYQRSAVWSNKESVALIDSVLRGIPLPSIILNERRDDDVAEIVDGKQRLTAILRFIGAHPDGLRFAEKISEEQQVPMELFEKNYRGWRKAVAKRLSGMSNEDERTNFLPFPFTLPATAPKNDPLRELHGKYYCEIAQRTVTIQGKLEKISKVFESPSTEYQIPVILYKGTEVRQIHRVFGLYNRQGKKLNATEVHNAIYHHLKLTRLVLRLSGDSKDPALAPYLAPQFELERIPNTLAGLNVAQVRFNRTKLTSWVVALLVIELDNTTPPSCPGSTKLIYDCFKTVDQSKRHPFRDQDACSRLAEILSKAAGLLDELRVQQAFAGAFAGALDDLQSVSAWTACCVAVVAGVEVPSAAVREGVVRLTRALPKLGKQQARSQWQFIAHVTLGLLDAMGVDFGTASQVSREQFGSDIVAKLVARRGEYWN